MIKIDPVQAQLAGTDFAKKDLKTSAQIKCR